MSNENQPGDGSGAVDIPNPEDIAGQSTTSPDEPDYRSMYEELKTESQAKSGQLEAQLAQARATADARMNQLENLVVQMANQGQQAGPEPIDPDDPAAPFKYAERLVEQKLNAANAAHEAKYRNLAMQALESEKRRVDLEEPLVAEKYGSEIEAYYREHPHELERSGSYEDLVTYLKGKHFDELAKAKQDEYKRKGTGSGILSPTPVPPTGGNYSTPPATNEPTLSEEEARLAKIYGELEGGDPISAEDYLAVKNDRVNFPGKRPRGR